MSEPRLNHLCKLAMERELREILIKDLGARVFNKFVVPFAVIVDLMIMMTISRSRNRKNWKLKLLTFDQIEWTYIFEGASL